MIVVRYTWHVEANFAEVRKLFMEITMPEVQRPPWVAWLSGKDRVGQDARSGVGVRQPG